MGAAGYTWEMRCVAPRMRRWYATGIPSYKEGLERRGSPGRACDVSCTPNDAPFNGQHCDFTVSFFSFLFFLRLGWVCCFRCCCYWVFSSVREVVVAGHTASEENCTDFWIIVWCLQALMCFGRTPGCPSVSCQLGDPTY